METQNKRSKRKAGRSPREAVPLKEHLNKRLSAYALAAGAAGVGLLGTAAPGKADIVYTSANVGFSNNSVTPIDLNHDGVTDFKISDRGSFFSEPGPRGYFGSTLKLWRGHLSLDLNNHNSVLLSSTGRVRSGVARLSAGYHIPPTRNTRFFGQVGFMASGIQVHSTIGESGGGYRGPWGRSVRDFPASGFIGLKFLINGQAHYGWAYLLDVQSNFFNEDGGYSGTLVSYAYESCANVGILAGATSGATCGPTTPEPGTLGLLALGSLGLGFWRRKKQEAVTSDK